MRKKKHKTTTTTAAAAAQHNRTYDVRIGSGSEKERKKAKQEIKNTVEFNMAATQSDFIMLINAMWISFAALFDPMRVCDCPFRSPMLFLDPVCTIFLIYSISLSSLVLAYAHLPTSVRSFEREKTSFSLSLTLGSNSTLCVVQCVLGLVVDHLLPLQCAHMTRMHFDHSPRVDYYFYRNIFECFLHYSRNRIKAIKRRARKTPNK